MWAHSLPTRGQHRIPNELRIRMADMRRSALSESCALRILQLAVVPDGYPPRIAGTQHVPLWKILPAPTPAITETGPREGPGFSVDCNQRFAISGSGRYNKRDRQSA